VNIHESDLLICHSREVDTNPLAEQMANWLVAFATPIFLAKSAYGAYFLFGTIALLTMIVLATCMRETRGQSLEDIQVLFAPPLA
jgi:hypothetical protein